MQDVIQEVIEILNNKDGQPIDTHQLSYGYVCSVMVSIVSVSLEAAIDFLNHSEQ